MVFEEKYFCYVLLPDQILTLLCEILGNMCIVILCKPDCDLINFEINLIFLIKPLMQHDQKVTTKI